MKTLYDLFSHVLDTEDAHDDHVNRRRALRAAVWGSEQTQSRHQWANYTVTTVARLNAPLTVLATVSATGLVTLDAAEDALPAWVQDASVQYSDHTFVISRRVSDTTLQLDGWGLGAIATNTSIRIVDDRYVLPDTVREIFEVRDEDSDIELYSVGPERFRLMQHTQNGTPSDPIAVTEVRTTGPLGQQTELRFVPAPSSQTDIAVSYVRRPRIASALHSCGSTAIAGSTVTVSSSLPYDLLSPDGLMLVVSTTASEPEPSFGFGVDEHASQIGVVHRVKSLTSRTELELFESVTAVTGKAAILTHELDFPEVAYNAAQRYAEAEFRRVGRGDVGEYWQTIQMADRELRLAMEQESKFTRQPSVPHSRPATYNYPENVSPGVS